MDHQNEVILHRDDPARLESLYRQDAAAFEANFLEAEQRYPDDLILKVWRERLRTPFAFTSPEIEKGGSGGLRVLVVLALVSGLATRGLFHLIVQGAIAPVNLLFGVVVATIFYFLYRSRPRRNVVLAVLGLVCVSILYINLLPLEETDSIILSYLHMPVFLWVVIGAAYAGDGYNHQMKRVSFLRFNGEFCVYYASIAIAGMLLAVLTLQLFGFLDMDIADLYFENVVVFGVGFLALITVQLVVVNLDRNRTIAPYIARIFSPLVLITLVGYLGAVVVVGENPFLDRDFLLSFNFVLMAVLAVTVFTITEVRTEEISRLAVLINTALILLALVIDGVALSAIVFRLSSYGLTPNRLAVLGMNLLILIHLVKIARASYQELKGRPAIRDAAVNYLPIYGLWAAFVSFFFPLFF